MTITAARADSEILELYWLGSTRSRPTSPCWKQLGRRWPCADRDMLARLLPALGGAYGSAPWLASEAVHNPQLAVLIGGWKAERLGKLLRRA